LPKVKVIGSTDFSVASLPVSPVNAGGTTSFQVTYQPTALNGAAEIVIANNDADEGPYRFALRGNTDADGDGMPDGWETLHNVSDATADEDGDGASNRDEFIAGTSPRDALSVFKIINTQRNGSSIEVTWTSAVSRTYKLYSRPSLPAANGDAAGWELVGEFAGTSGPITGSLPIAGSASRFFRVTTGF
jgi:hypothetical protein